MDNPADCTQREAQRPEFLHWNHESLFRLERESSRVILSIRLCIRRDVRIWNHYWCVDSVQRSISAGTLIAHRRHNTPRHSLSLPSIIPCPCSQPPHQPTVRHRPLHHMRVLSAFTLPRHSQTLPSIWTSTHRHAHHRHLGSYRRPSCTSRTQGQPQCALHVIGRRSIPSHWRHQLRLRLPSQLAVNLW